MLTLAMQSVIEQFARDLIKLIQTAIYTKPIKRISRRRVKGKYVDKSFEAPVNATGNLAKTLRYELTDTNLTIYANDYIFELIWGKPPVKAAMDYDLTLDSKIKEWMTAKGISSSTYDENTLSNLIRNKINKFGSSIYLANHGKNSGLLENIINQQNINTYNAKFTSTLEKEFKQAFNNA